MRETGNMPVMRSRIWLWVVRGLALAFALPSVGAALIPFMEFLRVNPEWWWGWDSVGAFVLVMAALLCSGLPYVLILWNLRRGPSSAKGLFQALIVGTFWFLFGPLSLIGSVFDRLAEPSAQLRKSAEGMFETVVVSCGMSTLLCLLFLGCALKASRSLGASLLASNERSRPPTLLLDRVAVGGTLVLFTLAAVLSLFAVGHALDGLRSALTEALLLCGLLPYAFVFQRLRQRGADRGALALECSLAIGCLTCCILGGSVWADMIPNTRWHHHGPYEWAELAFFALVALSNVLILRNIMRLKRSSVTPPLEPLTWISIFAIPVSLIIFLYVFAWYSFSV